MHSPWSRLKFFSNADIVLQWGIIPREVFLMIWAGIAFIAGAYLPGRINLKGESPDGHRFEPDGKGDSEPFPALRAGKGPLA